MIAMERNDNLSVAVSSDDEDPLEEEEAKLRSIHFLKRGESIEPGEDGKTNVSRYDEMSSFLTRSERSLHMADDPPSQEELQRRHVVIKEEAESVHDVEAMTTEEAKSYYMTEEDFRRVDIDVELTQMRYEKAKKNKGKYDEEENPTRGLEEFLDTQKRRATLRKKHRSAVLTEMVRQKTAGCKELDWEKIRSVAEPYSKETSQIAYEIALQDAGRSVPKSASSSKAIKSGKKKGGFFGMFRKK